MNDDLMNTLGYTPSRAVSDKTEKCNERAESFIPREGKSYACVLPKGHEGEHHGGGNCFKHGDYVGLRGCPVCFPDGAQVDFGNTSDKTDLRAACEKAAEEWILPRKYNDSARCRCSDCERVEALTKEARQPDIKELSHAIQRHIAPLLRSARIAAIEECVKHQPIVHENNDEIYITCRCGWDARKQEHRMIEVETAWQKHIRALKEKP